MPGGLLAGRLQFRAQLAGLLKHLQVFQTEFLDLQGQGINLVAKRGVLAGDRVNLVRMQLKILDLGHQALVFRLHFAKVRNFVR